MKIIITLTAAIFLIGATLKPAPVTVYLVGDSLMANKSIEKYPLTGWGQIFGGYFDSHVIVKNKALDGMTTRTFFEENHWQPILDSLKNNDYVFIGFGHNDEKIDLPKIGVPLNDFKNYLTRLVKESREKGAIPVLLTPVSRRSFKNGVFYDTHALYADAIRQVALQENVLLIDLQQKTEKIVAEMGDTPSKQLYNWVDSAATKAYPKGSKDNTHLSITGARKVAELTIHGIKELKLPLAKYLN